MSFQIHNTITEQIIENLVFNYINRIYSLTGPTGPTANPGVLTYNGTLLANIIPYENNVLNLGSENYNFQKIYTNTISINGITIDTENNVINLPAGTLIGGVSVGTIKILGQLNNSSLLPVTAEPGDAYVIETSLWVYSNDNTWIQICAVKGPPGDIGPTGPTGADGASGTSTL